MANEAASLLFTRRQPLFTQKAQPFLHIFTKLQRRLTCLSTVALCEGGWSRSLWSLVKRSAFAASEVAACRRVDVFLFTALRLHGGKPPWFFASSMGYDKNSYLFCAWNFRQLYRFLLVTLAKQMPQLISQNGQRRTETDDNGYGFQKNCPYLSVLSPFKSVRSPRVIHQLH